MSRPASPPRTFWQHLRRVLLVLLLLALSPFLVWWIVNRIDESPSPEAQRFAAPPSRSVADVDNAWLYLAGLGAPESEDPRVLGRRRRFGCWFEWRWGANALAQALHPFEQDHVSRGKLACLAEGCDL